MIIARGTDPSRIIDDLLEYVLFDIDLDSLNALRHYGDSFGYQSYSCFGLNRAGYISQIYFLRNDVIL
jgi:hypothetical protein